LNKAHSLEDFARDSLLIRHRLEGRHVLSQVLFVYASKHSQERPKRRPSAFATVAVDFTNTVSIVIARPLSTPILVAPMADR
jgi:hypothetical protein